MHFREIMRFRRTSAGTVPLEVLQSLELPMPEDVLEQLVFDHGTNHVFQQQYGHLELHALHWECRPTPAEEILACSVYPQFAEWVETAAGRTRLVPREGWNDVILPPGAAKFWADHGTWMRAPIMFKGDLVVSDHPLHLVEGHTRLGALRGLVESGVLSGSSKHLIWIGKGCTGSVNDGAWRAVLLKERMPFLDWLMGRVGDEGVIGDIASRLIDAKYSSMSRIKISGDDLASALAYADTVPSLMHSKDTIRQVHSEWESLMSDVMPCNQQT
jgi:hypothetical protein